jgi:tetratricopeptide (TPR) repeat protein
MRTLHLLRAFNDKEIAELDLVVAGKERKTLLTLYTAVKVYRKRNSEPTVDLLYKKVFNKKYTADKDYLIRNELRLLNKVFYDFLALAALKSKLKEDEGFYDVWLARALYDRRIDAVLDEDMEGWLRQAEERDLPAHTAALMNIGFYNDLVKPASEANHQELMKFVARAKEVITRNLRLDMRKWESMEAMALHRYKILTEKANEKTTGDYRTEAATSIDITPAGPSDQAERYFVLQKWTYQTHGNLRIEILQEALALLKLRGIKNNIDLNNLLAAYGSLGSELSNIQRVEEADACFAEGIALFEKHKIRMYASLVHNRMAAQLLLERYETGIAIYREYESQILKDPRKPKFVMLLCYCHLFLRQPDEALAALELFGKIDDEQNVVRRMAYLIAFCLRGQADLALNECENINRFLKARTGEWVENQLWINGLFRRFASAVLQNRERMKKEIQQLHTDLMAEEQRIKDAHLSVVPVLWLVKEVKAIVQRNLKPKAESVS